MRRSRSGTPGDRLPHHSAGTRRIQLTQNVRDQDLRMIGLRQEMVDAELVQSALMVTHDGGATDHDRLVGLGAFDAPANLDTGIDRQIEVDQRHVERTRVGKPRHALGTVARLDHSELLAPEELRYERAEQMFVFHQEETTTPFHRPYSFLGSRQPTSPWSSGLGRAAQT